MTVKETIDVFEKIIDELKSYNKSAKCLTFIRISPDDPIYDGSFHELKVIRHYHVQKSAVDPRNVVVVLSKKSK